MSVAEQAVAVWERRLRAPISFLPEWSPYAPDRCVYASNEAGVWQLYAWEPATGERRQVTDSAVGVIDGTLTVDAKGILWFEDETGDESGRWVVQPFAGGETQAFLEGVPAGWNEGLSQAPGIVAAGISDLGGFAVYVSLAGGTAREVYRSADAVRIGSVDEHGSCRGGLSADGSLLCLEHAEHGDLIHPALRVIDPRSGATVGEQLDQGRSLAAKCWSPVPGDERLATEPGVIWSARVRPDGRVWFLHEQGHLRRRVLADDGTEVLHLQGEPAPAARAYESWHFANPHG